MEGFARACQITRRIIEVKIKGMVRVWRQGDVVIREISPDGADTYDEVHDVLEVKSETGHPHTLKGTVYGRVTSWGGATVELTEPTPILHPQHATITLPSGTFQVRTVRDFRRNQRLD